MVSTVLGVWNLALEAAHAPGRVSSEDELSREREICSLFYDLVRRQVQEANYWPCCRAMAYLPLIKERNFNAAWVQSDPEPNYIYKYGLPDKYMRAWHLSDYSRFSLSTDVTLNKVVVHSNLPQAAMVYAIDQTDVTQWSPLQLQATIYGLAAHIAGPLTGKNSIIQKNMQAANSILETASAAAADVTQNDDVQHIPIEIAARGYGIGVETNRYYYPVGAHFAGLGDG